ncbi:MAG: hypothetical protein HYS38_00955 [Acidobacteria bacterium]|nr:hypothetical protein [Acidobacteriota bacterium]
MSENRFAIIFEKLAEVQTEELRHGGRLVAPESIGSELEEIAELRRLVLEITEPELTVYTAT